MGAGASVQHGAGFDLHAEWRSEATQELDRLGGHLRPAVKRGESTKYRLDWLKDAVHEQGDKLEEALAKDPLAGRHEINRQEALKVARQAGSLAHLRLSVKEWQTRRHTDIRAQEAELGRLARDKERNDNDKDGDQPRPEWNALHWTHTSIPDPRRPPLASSPHASADANTSQQGVDEASRSRARAPPMSEWRQRVAAAKRKALLIISVVLAFRGRKHRLRGLQRLDSLSFFIAQHLGPELPRFVEEQLSCREIKASAAELQALMDEVWRERRHRPGQDTSALMAGDGEVQADRATCLNGSQWANGNAALLSGSLSGLPGSAASTSDSPAPVCASGTAQVTEDAEGRGYGRLTPPPPLRVPSAWSGSGNGQIANSSSLLRSRPINLTPTLHHMSQPGGPSSAVMSPTGPSAPLFPLPNSPKSSQSGTAHSVPLPTLSASGAAGAGGPASGLPVLRRSSFARMSMPSGFGPALAAEADSLLSKGSRASMPGGAHADQAGVTVSVVSNTHGVGGDRAVGAHDEPVLAAAPAQEKRWSISRFIGRARKGGEAKGGPKAALLAEELEVAGRAKSWAGPLIPGMQGPPSPVPHSRSLGAGSSTPPPGGAGNLAVGVPSPPAAPSMPPPAVRNPRHRRNSISLLPGSTTPLDGGAGHSGSVEASPSWARLPSRTASSMSLSATPRVRPGSTSSGMPTGSGGSFAARSGDSASGGLLGRAGPRTFAGGPEGGDSRTVIGRRRSVAGDMVRSFGPMPSIDPGPNSSGGTGTAASAQKSFDPASELELQAKINEESAALERTVRMMHMYANRANARWFEEMAGPMPPSTPAPATSQHYTGSSGSNSHSTSNSSSGHAVAGFNPPHVFDAARFGASVGGAQKEAFKSEVVTALRAGRIAVQVLAGDDDIILADGKPCPLWSADPWDLIASVFPAKASAPERVREVRMGPRLLMAMAMAVEVVAGPEAVAKLCVVLHMNEDQQSDVISDLRYRNFCGLKPENLVLLVQQRRHGYVWDRATGIFARDPAQSQLASAGSGYAIMQLLWPEEAMQLHSEPETAPTDQSGSTREAPNVVPLGCSVLDHLASRGVDWLLTRRLRDINLYHPELSLDVEVLAYSLFLHDHMGANMAVQVEYVEGCVQAVRSAKTGVVLAPPRRKRRQPSTDGSRQAPTSPVANGTSPHPRHGGAAMAASHSHVHGSSVEPGTKPEGPHPQFVVDIKVSDTMTPRITQLLNDVKAKLKGRLVVSTRRYVWRVDMLKALVKRHSLFHPSLEVAGDLAFMTFDMADLTAALEYGARCVAIASRHPSRALLSTADLEELLGAIQAQEASTHFRRLASSTSVRGFPHRTHTAPTGFNASMSRRLPHTCSISVGHSPSPSSQPHSPGAGGVPAHTAAPPAAPLPHHLGQTSGQRIVIFVADNESTNMAVQLVMSMAKPGRDTVVLVTVVSSILQEAAGRALLRRHEQALQQTMVDVSCELLTRNVGGSLADQLEGFCDATDPNLIVMGSQNLSAALPTPPSSMGGGASSGAGNTPSWAIGVARTGSMTGATFAGGGGGSVLGGGPIMASIALTLAKSTTRSMLIVKSNAKHATITLDAVQLRMLVEVHHTSRHLLRYVCGRLLVPARGDKVFLGRGGAKDASAQDSVTSRRLLDNFGEIATQFHVPVTKRAMEEPFELAAPKFADHDKIHLIAVQVPAGRNTPASALNVLKAARSAVLIYKTTEAF